MNQVKPPCELENLTAVNLENNVSPASRSNNESLVVSDEENNCRSVLYKVVENVKNSRDVVTNEVIENVFLMEKKNIRTILTENYVQPLFTGIEYGSPASEDYMMIQPLTEFSFSPQYTILKSKIITERDDIDAANDVFADVQNKIVGVENSNRSPLTTNKVYDISEEQIGGNCSVPSVVNTVERANDASVIDSLSVSSVVENVEKATGRYIITIDATDDVGSNVNVVRNKKVGVKNFGQNLVSKNIKG